MGLPLGFDAPRVGAAPVSGWAFRLRRSAAAAAALVLLTALLTLITADLVLACGAPPPIQCARSTALVKAFAGPMVIAPIGGVVVIPVSVFVSATAGAMPPCPPPVSTTITLTSLCAPPPSSPPGSIVLPTPAPGIYGGAVALFFPPGPPRVCTITGSAATTWADGRVTAGFGDITICLVDPAPGNPAIPRLDMQLITPAEQQAHPGDGRTHIVRLTNNDPAHAVTGMFTSTSNQNGRLSTMSPPPAPGSGDGPGSAATPFTGDALPIDFGDPLTAPCVPLPDPDANTTMTITKPLTLAPGETRIVHVRQRSWPMCRSGSCSEALMKFEGTYANATPALACTQATFMVNSLVPPDFEWPDNGMMTRALPQPQGIVHQGNLPTHTFAGLFTLEAAPVSPPSNFQFLGVRTHVMDPGYGDNMGRISHDFLATPPLNTGQPVQMSLFLEISSLAPSVNAQLLSAMVKPGDAALGNSYFHIMTRSQLTGPGIPPALDSFFDVFYAVSLDGISGGLHRSSRILPGSITATPTGPTTMTVSFQTVFEPAPTLPPLIDRMELHVDPIANLIGVPPRHDRCEGAYPLSEGVQFMGDTTNAIGAIDGPPGSCGDGRFHAVWHTFTPATGGLFDIDTCGTNYDTVLAAFSGPDCLTLAQVGCDDDSNSGAQPPCTPSGLASRIEGVPLTAGQTYFIRVGGFDTTDRGPYKVLVTRVLPLGPCCVGTCCTITNQPNCPGRWLGPGGTCNPNPCGRPANNLCPDAQAISINALISGENCNADEAGDGPPAGGVGCASGSKGVWYSVVPPHTGSYTVSTCGSAFDTVLTVFSTDCTTFTQIACNDDPATGPCSGTTRAWIGAVPLIAGQTYRVRVQRFGPPTNPGGNFVVEVSNNNAGGACCDAQGNCTLTDAAACGTGTFTPGGTCGPTTCAPIGACCLAGVCTPTIQTNCPGQWLGAGAPCNPNPCTRGACCCGSVCQVRDAAACAGANQRFVGFLTACNPAGNNTAPCCRADFNQSGMVSVQDIFDFLANYFANDPCTDINGSGPPPSVQDIFDYLAAYFLSC